MEDEQTNAGGGEGGGGGGRARYGSFVETYRVVSFIMGVGLIYPNPRTETKRILCFLLMLVSVAPVSFMIILDMYASWRRRDIVNILRHSTIVGPFLAGFFKILIMFYKRRPAKELIEEIDHEYDAFNSRPRAHSSIISASIANSILYSERGWAVTVIIAVIAFPTVAAVSTIRSHLFDEEPQRYMVHDVNIPFMPAEDRFKSPVYEIVFAYFLYGCCLYIITFLGYDGFFGLCVNHACLKMELYCKELEEALLEDTEEMMRHKIVKVIKDQIKFSHFVDLIQDTFNIWLGLILIATMIQIGSAMYLISAGYAMDVRYIIFIVGIVLYIYVPCRYAAKLKHMSSETATLFYCAGWERVPHHSVRKMLLLMITRAQIPCEITAFNLFVFDMDLFVRVLNSSYSMYTLLRS